MFVPFETLPDHGRVWIYQSEKNFSDAEIKYIKESGESFVDSWQSHGNDLKGSIEISHGHFIIISIDESFYSASGCSIDKSVHFIQNIEAELKLSLTDRTKQAYFDGEVHFFGIGQAKQLIDSGELKLDSLIFNLNVCSKSEYQARFLVKAEESWLAKFFKRQQLSA